ncbi:MAG: peptidase [Flavipsychrobacter sp.]|nr:peptidase [Flavipsychrobacter sp.]
MKRLLLNGAGKANAEFTMRSIILLLILIAPVHSIGQEVKFAMPLKGVAGKDFFIDYYVDHDTTDGIRDVYCGTKTYNGHQGTDFLLSGYKRMDSGVYVYAAAEGIVSEVTDGYYDRRKRWIKGVQSNYVIIVHANGINTYYAHLMKHSLSVKRGDSVKVGQAIGKVGSSGYSAYPHLHFEVRNKERKTIDPFTGACSQRNTSYWLSQPSYDTSTFVINTGFVPYIPNGDTLQEGYLVTDTFYTNRDATVCFWALVHGLHMHDVILAEWYGPGGSLKYQYSYEWKASWWHDYTWPHINMPKERGKWAVKLYINGEFATGRSFYVTKQRKGNG